MADNNKNIADKLKKLQLTDEDFNAIAEDIKKRAEESKKRLLNLLESKRFNEIYNSIISELKKQDFLTDNPYSDFLFNDVTNDEFIDFCSVISNKELVPEVAVLPVNNAFFETEAYQYKDLKLEIIWGQGVAYIIKKK